MIPVSVPIKKRYLTQSVEQQQPLVQQGYVIAWAVTEVAALLGLLDFFITGSATISSCSSSQPADSCFTFHDGNM